MYDKLFYVIMLLLLIINSMDAQQLTLTSVVFDRENNEHVVGAHVYIEGSSLHAVTGLDGRFEITTDSYINRPLVISHIVYGTMTVHNPFFSLPDTLFVVEKENMLGDVVVPAARYSRRQLLNAFRREFLGKSLGATSCIIENEEKIDIWFNYQTHMLSASCDEPVIIHNRYLAYRIYLTLEKFEVEYPGRQLGVGIPLQVFLEGSTFFEDLEPSNIVIVKRRERVFIDSPPHFLRGLANEQLHAIAFNYITYKLDKYRYEIEPSECFVIKKSSDQKEVRIDPGLRPEDLIFSTYHGRIYFGEIGITRNNVEHSRIIFFTDTIFIDAWGNLSNPNDVLFMGYMGHFRIGDQLPVNYRTMTQEKP